jgi:hypothetical protein
MQPQHGQNANEHGFSPKPFSKLSSNPGRKKLLEELWAQFSGLIFMASGRQMLCGFEMIA